MRIRLTAAHFCLCLVVTLCASSTLTKAAEQPSPRMTFLDNGEVRIGMDLALGGAVTFISSKGHPGNIINSADLGRQIQMSHYSGPWPYEVGDKKPHPTWVGLGWNPIQTGDCYMNGKFHQYRLKLTASLEYRDLITGMAIEPVTESRPGDVMTIKSIVLSREAK